MRLAIRLILIVLATAAAVAPTPAGLVERLYSNGVYAQVQPVVTGVTNRLPVAVLDVGVGILLIWLLLVMVRAYRRRGMVAAGLRALGWLLTTGAVIYLLFLASWGLNYRRVSLASRLDFDRARITQPAALALAARAIERLNAGHAKAHASPFDPGRLYPALEEVQRLLGRPRPALMAQPKLSVFQVYFRHAGIDGMTVPVLLEVIMNPDLLPIEVPTTLAHEQAHIAGYAHESEANFLSWVACVRSGDPVAEYSAWFDAYLLAVSAVPRDARGGLPRLDDGPREDLKAIAARQARASPRVRSAARGVYDSYLRANRIEEGIENYGVVLQLLLGTAFESDWTPKMR